MNYDIIREDELYHYGVRGMKWGVRRYQNADGSLTAEGKKRAKQEYKADNQKARELGTAATIYGHATAKSLKRTIKLENKLDKQYAKDPSGSKKRTQSLRKKWDASTKTAKELMETYGKLKDAGEKHCNELISKYGKTAIKPIKYTDKKLPKGEYSPKTFKTMNETTTTAQQWIASGAVTLAGAAAMTFLNAPFALIVTPRSRGQKAADLERETYRYNRKH